MEDGAIHINRKFREVPSEDKSENQEAVLKSLTGIGLVAIVAMAFAAHGQQKEQTKPLHLGTGLAGDAQVSALKLSVEIRDAQHVMDGIDAQYQQLVQQAQQLSKQKQDEINKLQTYDKEAFKAQGLDESGYSFNDQTLDFVPKPAEKPAPAKKQ